jgi:ribosomal protein S27E
MQTPARERRVCYWTLQNGPSLAVETINDQLYRLVEEYYPALRARLASLGVELPAYVEQEFEDYLKHGCLEHGFLRVRCDSCHAQHLVALSCKKRGSCPSCGARRMAESAALRVDEVLPE